MEQNHRRLKYWLGLKPLWLCLGAVLLAQSAFGAPGGVGPESTFTRQAKTNTTAAGWRTKLDINSGLSLTNLALFAFTNTGAARFENGLSIATGQTLDWNGDVFLVRENPNTLAQRNGTTAQTNYLYNTWSNGGTDYERLEFVWTANQAKIQTTKGGAGAQRFLVLDATGSGGTLQFNTSAVARWQITSGGDLKPMSDNLYSVGVASFGLKNLHLSKTITAAGTTGAQTINKPSGQVNFAAGAQTLVVTCNIADVNSIITADLATDDATAFYIKSIVKASGSFTIKLNATATAETAVMYRITN